MRYAHALALASSVVLATHAFAQELPKGGELTDRIVNDPRPEAHRTFGLRLPAPVRSDKTVQFGKALRIEVPRAEPQPWRIGVISSVLKPIAKSDRIVVAFWARAEETEGGAPGKIASVQLEHATPPHTTLFAQPVVIGPEWRLHQVGGVAERDYPPQKLQVAMHLAAAKQVLDIGPVFILRYPQSVPGQP